MSRDPKLVVLDMMISQSSYWEAKRTTHANISGICDGSESGRPNMHTEGLGMT